MALTTPTTCPTPAATRREPGPAVARTLCMGTHLLVEMWRSPFSILADARMVERALGDTGAGNGGAAAAPDIRVHQFSPYGVSGTASVPGAHVVIHTWPENKYAAVDIFAGDRENAYEVLARLRTGLRPEEVHVFEVRRGELIAMEDT
ncbi:adenosylmethionine decarboxylase [Dissulfurirhabdus thermomarina]|uniref:Adenosylmethionine decarboxylase n=1 Tax=Dissulfurirhabdus thermomarina TaxID=1765737 RepID=A0A6N9TSQ4_DISTH|nr:adenosylmethionine decarboxylase [Dissulfurirhabdus thermomarina]NDY43113.1 adenosylmethionine decarboxylase [Dissulfurirhabdus thermomarina]NMX24445.1 adenosylmethionine decarboxylase [Dissulfurirhabdus thermomarina]